MTVTDQSKITNSEKKENLLASILCNVAIPIFVLSKLSGNLGAMNALFFALLFPLGYAIYDYKKRKIKNPISMLGFASVLIKGLFAFYKLDGFWFALQEAAIPTFLGLFTIVSAWMGKPLVNYFIYNENIFNIALLEEKLHQNHSKSEFKKLLWYITFIFGGVFFLGGVLNYILAINIIVSPAATEAFNKELAQMTLWSYFVIAIPKIILTMLCLWWFIYKLKKLTGLKASEMMLDKN